MKIPPVPLLPPELHWAKHKKTAGIFHIADAAGRLLCDGGPSMSRGVGEPPTGANVHPICLHVLQKRNGT